MIMSTHDDYRDVSILSVCVFVCTSYTTNTNCPLKKPELIAFFKCKQSII